MNNLSIIGNLTREPEVKETTTTICEFSIAYNDYKKKANYFNVVCFGKLAERASSFRKGQRIAISGALAQDRWEKDGKQQSKVKIIANSAYPLDKVDSYDRF
jgi:single stranded DNA-binding protein